MWYFVFESTMLGQHRIDHVLPDFTAQFFGGNVVVVLRGNHHGVDAQRLAVHVFDAHLALAVRAQEVERTFTADLAQPAHQLVRQHDGQRHQLVGFVAGVAEHQALIARAAGVYAHGDVGRLALDGIDARRRSCIEAHSRVV
jgi:hypothetical protein